MCDDLNAELERGNEAAKALCNHVQAMGADRMTNNYLADDGSVYTITVERQPVAPSSNEAGA